MRKIHLPLPLLVACLLLTGCLVPRLNDATGYFVVDERLSRVLETHVAQDGTVAVRAVFTEIDSQTKSIRHERYAVATPEVVQKTVDFQPAKAFEKRGDAPPVVRLQALPLEGADLDRLDLNDGYPGGKKWRWTIWPPRGEGDATPETVPPAVRDQEFRTYEYPTIPPPGGPAERRQVEDQIPLIEYDLPDGRRVALDFSTLQQHADSDFKLGRTAGYVAVVPFAAVADVVGFLVYTPFRYINPLYFALFG